MTTRVNHGTLLLARSTNRFVKVSTMSLRTVQHRQPLLSSTTSSLDRSTRRWSRPISPNSLTITAVAAMSGCFNTWLSTVVLPLPRKPVSRVAGINDAGSVELIPDRPLLHPGWAGGSSLAAEVPLRIVSCAILENLVRAIGAHQIVMGNHSLCASATSSSAPVPAELARLAHLPVTW